MPFYINIKYNPTASGASSNGVLKISFLPIECQGVLEADPSGGISPVSRTLANTETFTTDPSQLSTISIPVVDSTKTQSVTSDPFSVAGYYPGDIILIRIEYDDDGDGNKDISIWNVDLSGVKWKHGNSLGAQIV